jgi:uncharacterized membrane protein
MRARTPRGPRPLSRTSERAVAVVLTTLTLLVGVIMVAVLAVSARVVRARANAQTFADAAALAAAAEGDEGATRLAQANHAVIVAVVDDDRGVVVTVRIDGVEASARAATRECRGSCPSIP